MEVVIVHIFKIFQMLLMAVTWTNVEVDVPVYSSIDQYITIPQAQLVENGNVFIDDEMYYVYNGVDNTYYSDLTTNYVGKIRHTIKVVYPTYGIESKQEIVFNIVDTIKPIITSVPHFQIQVGQQIPDLSIGFDYKDNYYLKTDLIVNILGQETINTKRTGKYYFTYQVIDPSNNTISTNSYVEVVDSIPPEIIKLKSLEIEIGQTLDIFKFYKFIDNHDVFVEVIVDDSNVFYDKVGTYPIYITVSDVSGNLVTISDALAIIHTESPILTLHQSIIYLEVNSLNLLQTLTENIKEVFDKVDVLTVADVEINHMVNLNLIGLYEAEYKVKNSNNLETIKTAKINIVDTTKPLIEVINELVIPYGFNSFIHQNYFRITDNYDEYSDLTINFTQKIDFSKLGSYPLRIEVIDKSKNKAVMEVVFKVLDLEPPIFVSTNEEVEVEVFSKHNFSLFTIQDNYDKDPKIIPQELYFKEVGVFEIVLAARDSSGNETLKTVVVTVVDNEAPTLILSTNEIKFSIGQEKLDPLNYLVEIFDNYDQLTTSDVQIIDEVNYNALGKYKIIYFVKDNSNNETVKFIEVTIDDTSKPEIITENIQIKYNSLFDIWDGVIVNDNSDNLSLISNPSSIDTSKIGTYIVTYTAIDPRGNITKTKRQIEVINEKGNLMIGVYIGLNFLITGSITTFAYLYFVKKKRK